MPERIPAGISVKILESNPEGIPSEVYAGIPSGFLTVTMDYFFSSFPQQKFSQEFLLG